MKKKELFIGIDVSKLTFDATIIPKGSLQTAHHEQFKNQKTGFKQLAKWIKLFYPSSKESSWVFCMENTGVYSYHLCCFFEENMLDYKLGASSVLISLE
jgi:transposase